MKFIHGLILFSLLILVKGFSSINHDYKSYVNAMSVVIKKFYNENVMGLELLIAAKECESFANDVIEYSFVKHSKYWT
jgi:hypothetical protein